MKGRLEDVQGDMVVFGSDGEKVGTVGGISFTETGETHIAHPTPAISPTRYLQVRRGLATDLYVPEGDIQAVELGQGVVLDVTAKEATQRYSSRPNIL